MILSLQSSIHLLSAMSTNTSMLLLITLWASIQDGLGLSLVKQLEVEAAEGVPTHRVRTRRCACSSQMDSECHYFCHLDIIWVNTASKTTIYGLDAPSRHKRSVFRCTCADTNDETCTNFCHHRPEITSPLRSGKRRPFNILSILWSKRVLGKPVSAEALRTQRPSLLRQRE